MHSNFSFCLFWIFFHFLRVNANNEIQPIRNQKDTKHKDLLNFYIKISQKMDFINERIDLLEKKIPDGLITDLDDIQVEINKMKTLTKNLYQQNATTYTDIQILSQKIETEIKAIKNQKVDQTALKNDIVNELTAHFNRLFQTKMDEKMNEANIKFDGEIKKLNVIIQELNKTITNNNKKKPFTHLPIWMNPNYTINSVNPCKPNPCLYGGSCVLDSNGNDYQCELCPYPMGGKNCQNLDCEDGCFRLKDTVYFVNADRSTTWEEANNKCIGKGTSLALIKDDATYKLIQTELNTLYSNLPFTFWIGLQRTSASDTWSWVDGAQFDSNFNGWFVSSVSGNCAGMTKGNGVYNLNAESCDGASTRKFYPLCQKRFSFF